MTTYRIDETLITQRRVMGWVPAEEGFGFDVNLECGHSIWLAVRPGIQVYCGVCLQRLVTQIVEIQKQQEM